MSSKVGRLSFFRLIAFRPEIRMILNHKLKAPRSEPCCPTIRSEAFPARLVFGDKTSLVHLRLWKELAF